MTKQGLLTKQGVNGKAGELMTKHYTMTMQEGDDEAGVVDEAGG